MRSPKQIKPQSPAFAVEWWPIGRVTPYPNNARVIPASAVEKVASSIRSFGWRQPIVVDTEGVIVVGHVRLLAAQSMALTAPDFKPINRVQLSDAPALQQLNEKGE